MGKMISKMFATGISKIYYKVENEFVATGTLFTNFGMYYYSSPSYFRIVDVWYGCR